ncbi:MAG: efflux RND transporter periplasmic adaptor subunit [Ferruginibacter sp.]|nr:efflux RND transporter periplasmic adaptor subunit [Cytophagales bacterium]
MSSSSLVFMTKKPFYSACLAIALVAACQPAKKDPKAPPPVAMSNPGKESDLNTITLTDQALERLGIQTVGVQQRAMGNTRVLSGEIVALPGRTITVTAPVAGTLLSPTRGRPVAAGQEVKKGERLYRLLILPSERDLISAQQEVAQRKVQYEVGTQKLNRAQQLLADKAGSLRTVQEAEAELAGVNASLRVAEARLELLGGNPSESVAQRLSTLNVEAPIGGMVQRIYSSPSQVVATAAPVMDIVSLSPVWVRVPIYAGEATRIDPRATASVRVLSDFSGSSGEASRMVTARPVRGPLTADALATSIDAYYEIANAERAFRPGQRVSVTVSYRGSQSSLVVPNAAILYDMYGGTWVYENTGPRVFVRRRVELAGVSGGLAILKRGLTTGTKVVTAGAAELFGTEFGGGK